MRPLMGTTACSAGSAQFQRQQLSKGCMYRVASTSQVGVADPHPNSKKSAVVNARSCERREGPTLFTSSSLAATLSFPRSAAQAGRWIFLPFFSLLIRAESSYLSVLRFVLWLMVKTCLSAAEMQTLLARTTTSCLTSRTVDIYSISSCWITANRGVCKWGLYNLFLSSEHDML